jgi:hypothetical protein
MPKLRGTRAKRKAEDDAKRAEEEQDAKDKENQELKLKLAAAQSRLKFRRGGDRTFIAAGTQSAIAREVAKASKTSLWKVCKFIRNESKLLKATKFVMETLALSEMHGLEGEELVSRQEEWKAEHSGTVRKSINMQRNYVQQELRDVMRQVFRDEREAEFPNPDQMMELILRNKLDDATSDEERQAAEVQFDNLWNLLLPKVAGHKNWGPNKRHYLLPSFARLEVDGVAEKDQPPLVSATDEAFLALVWANCYSKWWYKEECRRKGEVVDKKHARYQTPFTDAKAGQARFGGYSSEGIAMFKDLAQKIAKNRKENAKYVKEVEELALERIRAVEKVAEKEANRKSKKRKAKGAGAGDESTDDENDYGSW